MKNLNYILPNNIALIGCIEKTDNNELEKNCLLLIKSLRKFGGKYKDIDIHLLQPTNNNISKNTKKILDKYNVFFHKRVSEYNQPDVKFNYTNMPITCNYFYKTIRNKYNYFLWLDCDTLILNEPTLIKNQNISFMYDNEFKNKGKYIVKTNEKFNIDNICYADLLEKLNYKTKYTAVNSWFILGESKNLFWKEWNNETKKILKNIKKYNRTKFLFFNYYDNFENRIEEISFSIVIDKLKLKQVKPIGIVLYKTPDHRSEIYERDEYNIDDWVIHYDKIDKFLQNKKINQYPLCILKFIDKQTKIINYIYNE
tara:strand:- start:160 stop:1095 length:936 start_codon:yes stop_codon:yes gene_type:complete